MQRCNQEFFRAGDIFWNKSHFINISFAIHERKSPQGKMQQFFDNDNSSR